MIVYSATKSQFNKDVHTGCIEDIVLASFKKALNKSVALSEMNSWKNSMMYMSNVLMGDSIPGDAGVAIEYSVPQTSKRIDFILTGMDANKRDTAIIVELKQWSEVEVTNKDAIVRTFLGKSDRETQHPSYQAWSYAALLEDFNETVREDNIAVRPCAYLHNCTSEDAIKNIFYQYHIDKAPVFLKKDAMNLREFIASYVKYGDSRQIMYRIDSGKITPSKSLVDCLLSMLHGNTEFLMIDEQKLVYETALDLANQSQNGQKQVLIVEGGPGTGKSVVAINLLVKLTSNGMLAHYVTKNSAPRAVYESRLAGTFTKSRISNLFKGSGAYTESVKDTFDVLVVDEAHRLNEKSGMFQNLGENQIKEIVDAAKCSIFFIDEDQRVTLRDIGEKSEIHRWAAASGAIVHELALESQFRCNGSDGFLAWIDNLLQIRGSANPTLEGVDYDVQVLASPDQLRDLIFERNKINNRARLVAGYCWDWASKKNSESMDIEIEGYDFAMRWNLASDGGLWIAKPNSVNEVGCIHTCQGLELDYVGVIIGPDLLVRNGVVCTDALKRSSMDSSIKGYKTQIKVNPEKARRDAELIIKNTYRTLLSRGQKGCYIYCVDAETSSFFKEMAKR